MLGLLNFVSGIIPLGHHLPLITWMNSNVSSGTRFYYSNVSFFPYSSRFGRTVFLSCQFPMVDSTPSRQLDRCLSRGLVRGSSPQSGGCGLRSFLKLAGTSDHLTLIGETFTSQGSRIFDDIQHNCSVVFTSSGIPRFRSLHVWWLLFWNFSFSTQLLSSLNTCWVV